MKFDTRLAGGLHTFISGSGGYTLNHQLDFNTAQKGSPFVGGTVTVHAGIVKHGLMQVTLTSRVMVVDLVEDNHTVPYRTLVVKDDVSDRDDAPVRHARGG